MAFGVFLAVRLYKKSIFDRAQRVACIALFVWVAIVMLFTVLGRRSNKTDEMVYNLELFRCYHKIFMEQDRSMLISVLENILMFVPIGFTLSGVFKKHRVIIPMVLSFGLSLCIETCQLLLHSGVFELDDLFNNTLGAVSYSYSNGNLSLGAGAVGIDEVFNRGPNTYTMYYLPVETN